MTFFMRELAEREVRRRPQPMPSAPAARRAAAERLLIELPADVLGLVLYQLPLAHDIALSGLTCRALCEAAKLALKARPFSGEVVRLAPDQPATRSYGSMYTLLYGEKGASPCSTMRTA